MTLLDVFAVNRFGFTPADGDGHVSGSWVLFDGTCDEAEIDVQTSELHEARWFAEPPETVNEYVEARVARWAGDPSPR